MTIKVTYNVTDIYVSESVSATYINVSYETPIDGSGFWGDITGTLSDQLDLQAALDAKVPYTGATANVDLGEYELKAGQLELDQTPTGVAGVAVTRWNDSVGTIETTLKGGSVVLKHGRDMFERVVNKTGIQLTRAAYQAVRVSDAQGQRLAVSLAQANNDNNSADTIGLVVETIDNNQEGYIYTVGEIDGVNTTGSLQGETWVDGDVLYLSPTTAGRITNVKPVAPQHLVIIGYVVYAHQNNGKIYVKVMNGWELGELHNVDETGAVAGNVLKYNGTIWTPSGDVGITSLNGLNAVSQTFATGTSGTDFNISSATSTHTFNLPSASSTNRGLLTSADWTTFNNKQNALTNPVTGTGVSGQVAYWSGTNTQTGSNNLFWDATNSRLGVGTNTPSEVLHIIGRQRVVTYNQYAISIYKDATPTVAAAIGINSSLSSLSFNMFSGSWLNDIVTITSTGRLLVGGTSDNGLRFQVTGDGFFSGSLGIGSTGLTGVSLRVAKNVTGSGSTISVYNDGVIQSDSTSSSIGFYNVLRTQAASFNINFAYHFLAVQNTLGAGSTITNQFGFLADSSLTSATNNYGFYGNIAAATGRWNFYAAGSAANYMAGSLGIGSTTLTGRTLVAAKNITGSVSSYGISQIGVVQSDVTSNGIGYYNLLNTQAASFTLTNYSHYYCDTLTIGAGSAITNQYGFRVATGMTGASNNYAFYSNLAAAAGVWNLYMNGSAQNYLNGSTGIGTNAPISRLTVQGVSTDTFTISGTTVERVINFVPSNNFGNAIFAFDTTNANAYLFNGYSGGALIFGVRLAPDNFEAMRIYAATRNVSIGTTTDAGFKLDVNGTMKVTGESLFGSNLGGANRRVANFRNSGGNGYIEIQGSGSVAAQILSTSLGDFYVATGGTAGTYGTTRLTIDNTGAATFSSSVTSTQFRLSALNTAPASATATGTLGEIRIDADYIYICTATNTWKRVAIATW